MQKTYKPVFSQHMSLNLQLTSLLFVLLINLFFHSLVHADDVLVSFPNGTLVSESDGSFVVSFKLIREQGSDNAVSIDYSTGFSISDDQAATPGKDYTDVNGSISWAALTDPEQTDQDQTINILITNDIEQETNEVFDLVISTTDTQITLNGTSVLRNTIVISDDDVVATEENDVTATNSVASVLNVFCPQLESGQDEQELIELCDAFNSATPQEASDALQALSPEASISQTNISYQGMSQQLGNISKRLKLLRSGSKSSGLDGLAFRLKGHYLPMSGLIRNAQSDTDNNLEGLLGKRYDIFTSGTISYGEREDTPNESGYIPHSYNLTIGADYRFSPKLIFGAAMGGMSTDAALSNNGGDIQSRGFNATFYSLYFHDEHIYLNSVINVGISQMKLNRNIVFSLAGLPTSSTAKGDSTSSNTAVSIDGGYNLPLREGFNLNTSLQLSYLKNTNSAYEETGDSAFNVAMDEQKSSTFSSMINLELSKAISSRFGVIVPAIYAQWLYDIGNQAETVTGHFIDDPLQTQFQFDSDDPDTSYYQLGTSVSAVLAGGISIFSSFQTILGQDHFTSYSFSLGARMESPF